MPSRDTWGRDYAAVVELGAKIGVIIRERDADKSDAKLNPHLSKLLQNYWKKYQALKELLNQQKADYSIPDSEIYQREDQVRELSEKFDHLKRCFDGDWSKEPRYSSMGIEPWERGGARGGARADDLLVQQREMIKEQDEGLEELSRALRNQQKIGLAMQDEIQEHNVLIDDISEHTSRTDTRVHIQAQRAKTARKKDSCMCSCGLWCTIVLLAVVIVVVAAVPF